MLAFCDWARSFWVVISTPQHTCTYIKRNTLQSCTVFIIYCASKLHVFEWRLDAKWLTSTVHGSIDRVTLQTPSNELALHLTVSKTGRNEMNYICLIRIAKRSQNTTKQDTRTGVNCGSCPLDPEEFKTMTPYARGSVSDIAWPSTKNQSRSKTNQSVPRT